MTVTMDTPQSLEAQFDELELPAGWKAEFVDGEIVVTPPPNREHGLITGDLGGAIAELGKRKWNATGDIGLSTPLGRFIPDLTVAPREYFQGEPEDNWLHTDGVHLVIEVTSTQPDKDRGPKRRGYALAGIPLYLLIDRDAKKTVLFSLPEDGDYGKVETRRLGEPIPLPAPFGFALEGIG